MTDFQLLGGDACGRAHGPARAAGLRGTGGHRPVVVNELRFPGLEVRVDLSRLTA